MRRRTRGSTRQPVREGEQGRFDWSEEHGRGGRETCPPRDNDPAWRSRRADVTIEVDGAIVADRSTETCYETPAQHESEADARMDP